jgi:hypothetical protein
LFHTNIRLHLSYLIGRSEALSELAGLLAQGEANLFRALHELAEHLDANGGQDAAPIIARITRERRELLSRIRDVRDESDIESKLAIERVASKPPPPGNERPGPGSRPPAGEAPT